MVLGAKQTALPKYDRTRKVAVRLVNDVFRLHLRRKRPLEVHDSLPVKFGGRLAMKASTPSA
jgi:hypothetical protein